MAWEIWSVFAATEAVLCLTPGPAVLFVVSHSLGRGAPAATWAAVGILAGNTLYFLLSATGLGAIILASYDLFFAIKWAGAAYLVWLGVSALRRRGSLLAVRPAEGARESAARVVGRGFLVQAANPKALVFFTALLPQFIDPGGQIALQVAILAVTSVVIELAVLVAYGALAARATRLLERPRFVEMADRAAGVLLIAAGVRMAAFQRTD